MAFTRKQIAAYEAYTPGWENTRIRTQPLEVPTLEQVQATLTGEASPNLTFSDYLSAQSAEYQRNIFEPGEVGRQKYLAFRRGDLVLTKLPPQSPIPFAVLMRRNSNPDPDVVSDTPIIDPTGTPIPRRAAARIRANAANAATYNGNKLLTAADIPAYNYDALAAFLHSLTPAQIKNTLPAGVYRNWQANPTAGGLKYDNNTNVSFMLTIKKLEALLDE